MRALMVSKRWQAPALFNNTSATRSDTKAMPSVLQGSKQSNNQHTPIEFTRRASSLRSQSSWPEQPYRAGTATVPQSRMRQRVRCCGYSTLPCWIWILLVAFFIIALSVGVGVGVGIGIHKQLGDVGYSHTGLVSIDLANGQRSFDTFFMIPNKTVVRATFYQGGWINSTQIIDIVSQDAKPGTPLMALSYTVQQALSWRVLYVDVNGYLQEAMSNNETSDWWKGSLGAGNFKFNPTGIGLTACVNYNYYGDSNDGLGIRLYYSAAEGGIKELMWKYGSEVWQESHTFPNSRAGGCECVVRGTSTTHVWLQNNDGQLQQWWYDFNSSAETATHPTQQWVAGVTSSGLRNGSAIGAIQVNQTRFVHYQADTGVVFEVEAQGNAENTTLGTPLQVAPALLGTKLSAVVLNTTYYSNTSNGQEIHVFAQAPNGEIIDHIRTLDGSTWGNQTVPLYL